jgi:hypothetical protein
MDTETPYRDTLTLEGREVFAYLCSMPTPTGPKTLSPETDPAADGELHLTPVQIEVDAKLHEIMYPDRVRRIVAAGGLAPDLDLGRPEATMVAALLRRAAEREAGQPSGFSRNETADHRT